MLTCIRLGKRACFPFYNLTIFMQSSIHIFTDPLNTLWYCNGCKRWFCSNRNIKNILCNSNYTIRYHKLSLCNIACNQYTAYHCKIVFFQSVLLPFGPPKHVAANILNSFWQLDILKLNTLPESPITNMSNILRKN